VLVQGGSKLALNIYRGWVGERAKRDLRRRVHTIVEAPLASSPAAEAQGITITMIVAEVEPIGGFVGESVSEPLLQAGIMVSVFAYLIHIDPWIALTAFALFVPQLIFVPLLQAAVNRRTGARIRVLRQLGIAMIDRTNGIEDELRIDQAFALDIGIFKIKFTEFLDEFLQLPAARISTADRGLVGLYGPSRNRRCRRLYCRDQPAQRSLGRSRQLLPRCQRHSSQISPAGERCRSAYPARPHQRS
jgi:hypothetical protein